MRIGYLAVLGCVLLLLALSPATAAPPESLPQTRTAEVGEYDHWYSCLLGTQKIGWMHSTRTVADGKVSSTESSNLTIRRGAVAMTVATKNSTVETPDGQPLRFSYEVNAFGSRQITKGTVNGDKLHLHIQSPAGVRKHTIPLPPQARWPFALEREMLTRSLKAGTTGTVKAYMPDLNAHKSVTFKWTIGETVTRQVAGRPMRITPIAATIAEMEGVAINLLLDENHEMVQNESAIGGLLMRVVRSTRDEAMKPGSAELFFSTLVRIKKAMPPRMKIRQAVYLLQSKDGGKIIDLPTGTNQTVRRVADDQLLVTVRRGAVKPAVAARRPYAGKKDMSAYLASSMMIDHRNALIANAALRVVGDENDALTAARKLEQFVHSHISGKNLSRGMDPASVVMKRREGDCTEHAVLLAALCRAAGIPSRCATGLIYFNSIEAGGPCFGYHMWTEVWIGNRWIGLDATLAKGRTSATHIRLAGSALSDQEGMLALARGITVVGNLKITARKIEVDEE